MSRLEELIQKYCPDGIETKVLSEVTMMSAGDRITKSMMSDDSEFPVMGAGVVPTGYYIDWNKEGCVTISRAGAGAGSIGWHPEKFWATDVCFVAEERREIARIKYVYYAMKAQESDLKKHIYGGSMPKIDKLYLWNLSIPVPPLHVQDEIVRILDAFSEFTTKLTTELIAELEARKKQYIYYRDMLLQNSENNKPIMLKELVKIKNGKDYKHLNKGKYPVYGSGGIMAYVDEFVYEKPTVLIPRKGSLDKLYYVETPFWNVDTIFFTEINENIVMSKYLFYLLQKEHLEQYNTAGGVPSLTQTVLNNVSLLIPSLEEQQRIVDILDRFDALCNEISTELSAEIKLRQQQYEYFRDKLLTFKQKK